MAQKLYDILFEDAPSKLRPDLQARLAALKAKSQGQRWKGGTTAGEFTTTGLTAQGTKEANKIIGNIKDKLDDFQKTMSDPDPTKIDSAEEFEKAFEKDIAPIPDLASKLHANVATIGKIKFPDFKAEPVKQEPVKTKAVEPQPKQAVSPTAKTEPQKAVDVGSAKTEPQMAAVKPLPKTQEVPQANIEDIMRQQANMQNAQRQAEIEKARMQSAKTTPLPKQGMFQRLRQRIGLEEAIKTAIKDGMKKT